MSQRLDRIDVPDVLEPELPVRLDGAPLLHALVAGVADLLGHDDDDGHGHDAAVPQAAAEALLRRYEELLEAPAEVEERAAMRSLRQLGALAAWAIDDAARVAVEAAGLVAPPTSADAEALARACEGAIAALSHAVDGTAGAPGPDVDGTCLAALVDAPESGDSWPLVGAGLAADDAALAALAASGLDAALGAADALVDELAEGADEDDPLVAWADAQAARVGGAADLAAIAYRIVAWGRAREVATDGARAAEAAAQARAGAADALIELADPALVALVELATAFAADALASTRRPRRRDDDRGRRGPARRG